MGRVLPILFNTDMVQAILEGRKTVTRRCVKLTRKDSIGFYVLFMEKDDAFVGVTEVDENDNESYQTPPYQKGDTLYVRETWCNVSREGAEPEYYYYADTRLCEDYESAEWKWRPSIHMPKEAARIWLEVTDVRVERLQDMTDKQAEAEGIHWDECPAGYTWKPRTDIHNCYTNPVAAMAALWNRTLTKDQKDRFGWADNPWVWVIEFERCEKP